MKLIFATIMRRATGRALAAATSGILIIGGATSALAGGGLDLELRTKTQEKAVSSGKIVVEVRVAEEAEVKVKGHFRAGASDEEFKLGSLTKQVDEQGEKFRFKLSPKNQELMFFAADQCVKTPVTFKAKTLGPGAGESETIQKQLKQPASC